MMKKSILLFVLGFTLSIFVQASDVEKSTTAPLKTMNISGVIADMDTEETLAGVLVKIEGTNHETLTNLDGKFTFEGIEAGDYNLQLSYISYQEVKVENITTDKHHESLDLKLKSE